MKNIIFIAALAFSTSASAQQTGSAEYCNQLAEIGANAYRTKAEGYSLSQVLNLVGQGLAHDPQKQRAAQGVVTAIYGDASIKSPSAASKVVFSACRRS